MNIKSLNIEPHYPLITTYQMLTIKCSNVHSMSSGELVRSDGGFWTKTALNYGNHQPRSAAETVQRVKVCMHTEGCNQWASSDELQ